jgi:uncharacterized protein with NRDE domain
MCLIALALEQHPRFALVIAANRDEYLHRGAAALDWWQAKEGTAPVLGGRDLQAGGTWLALNARGRVALLTNVRDPSRLKPDAPSRGAVVPAWLDARGNAATFWRETAKRNHNPFNLLAGDLMTGAWWWADDRANAPRALGPGLYGLSNAALDTPWPKVQRLKQAVATALEAAATPAELEDSLFAALADRGGAPDAALPDTGIGLERERWLAPAFIRSPDGRYGTRCSTLLIVEHANGGQARPAARLIERQFDAQGNTSSQRRAALGAWPLSGALPPVQAEPLTAA